jgi:membrane fusion protein, heavy metal efflux system
MKRLIIILFAISPILFSCTESKADSKETTPSTAPAPEPDQVTLTPEQIKNAAIAIGKPELKEMQHTLKVSGQVDVPPQSLVSISVPLGGYVKSMNLLPGTAVRKGTLLAKMEDQQYIQLQQDYLVGKSRLQYLEADYQRQKGLNETKAISDKTFQQVKSEYQSQRVLVNALAEKLRLIGLNPHSLHEGNISKSINIYSPFAGYVSKVNFNVGKYVTGTDVLMELVNPSDIHVSLTVFEKDVAHLALGQRVLCYTNSNPTKKYVGKIALINQSVDGDRSSEIHCHLNQFDNDLRPGMFLNGDIELTNALLTAVPDDAVVRWQNKHYVFVVAANNTFVMTPVELGASQNGYTAINGTLADKQVVTQNAYAVLMQLKNSGEED